jgi:hypothetical protein
MMTMTLSSFHQRRALKLFLMCILTTCIYSHGLVLPPVSTKAKSFVELNEPETNCRVILLGCLHGSRSSARDVHDLMDQNDVDVVVLELCASRVAALRRQAPSIRSQEERQFSLGNFVNMVQQTSEKRGLGSGAAVAVLGGASGLQTALSGFEAGLEFSTALELAKKYGCNVVLADQAVDETLARVGSLPSTSLSMLFQEEGLPLKESRALKTAVFGDDALQPFQVNMGNVLTRNPAVTQELLKLTLPPMSLAILTGTVVDSFYNTLFPSSATTISWWTLLRDYSLVDVWNSVGFDLLSSVVVLLLGYVALALPAIRVILCERDDQLADGIRAACKSAVGDNNNKENATVIAVLGLLHVNGVAKRLLQKDEHDTIQMMER